MYKFTWANFCPIYLSLKCTRILHTSYALISIKFSFLTHYIKYPSRTKNNFPFSPIDSYHSITNDTWTYLGMVKFPKLVLQLLSLYLFLTTNYRKKKGHIYVIIVRLVILWYAILIRKTGELINFIFIETISRNLLLGTHDSAFLHPTSVHLFILL